MMGRTAESIEKSKMHAINAIWSENGALTVSVSNEPGEVI